MTLSLIRRGFIHLHAASQFRLKAKEAFDRGDAVDGRRNLELATDALFFSARCRTSASQGERDFGQYIARNSVRCD